MNTLALTMKLHLNPSKEEIKAFKEMTKAYAQACTFVSQYMFDHEFILNAKTLQSNLYHTVRETFNLKSQLAVSVFRTVTARYKTLQTQLEQRPYHYKVSQEGEKEKWISVPRTLEWLMKPVVFSRPQADLVRNRDYSFPKEENIISLNTLDKRVKVSFDRPECFEKYFDGTWKFGTGKLVSLKGEWYFHIPVTKNFDQAEPSCPKHVVGIDRGLRFLCVAYDEKGTTRFIDGKEILKKRQRFADTRAQLQAKGTKSSKRVLKRIAQRENRWMSDVNHQISKTLADQYGKGTLFVLEDLTNVSFAKENLRRSKDGKRELRSWAFYEFEKDLEYKAQKAGAMVIKVDPAYTSQRCPKCGRIHKANRNHKSHEYICDCCGYRSNDDRIGAMNLYILGTLYVSGDENPKFKQRKVK